MFRKIVKGLLALSIAAILLCAGILTGGRFQDEYQQEQEQHTEATRKIAVVNLDSGCGDRWQKNVLCTKYDDVTK